MSFILLKRMKYFWYTRMFFGQIDFSKVTARERYLSILSSFLRVMDDDFFVNTRTKDPFWNLRGILGAFQRRSQEIDVSALVSSLYENSFRTKARIKARSHIPSKPDNFAARFIAAGNGELCICAQFSTMGQPTAQQRNILNVTYEFSRNSNSSSKNHTDQKITKRRQNHCGLR